LSLAISEGEEEGSKNILIKDLVCGYTDGFCIGPVSMDIPFKKRICIVGPNGTGKTTILKTITGGLQPISGSVHVDSGVRFGNFMQEHESLPKEKTPVTFLKDFFDLDRSLAYNHLVQFGFSETAATAPIKTLSPGNRARLLFAYFAAQQVNTLILDEPTNHLDMEAEAALEEALHEFHGTIITVSHDRAFVEKMTFDEYYVVSNTGIDKLTDFSVYVEEMQLRAKKLIRLLGK